MWLSRLCRGFVSLLLVWGPFLVWGLGVPQLPAASSGQEDPLRSGTYRGRILTEQFRHRQAVARRARQAKASLTPEPVGILRPDVGEIAVIDSADGVVIEPNTFDLEGRSVHLLPGGDGYSVVSEDLAFDEQARDDGTAIALADDDAVKVAFPFPFFGETHNEIFVHSDGNATFVEPETSSSARSLSRAASGPHGLPRSSPILIPAELARRSRHSPRRSASSSHGTAFHPSPRVELALDRVFSSRSSATAGSGFTSKPSR